MTRERGGPGGARSIAADAGPGRAAVGPRRAWTGWLVALPSLVASVVLAGELPAEVGPLPAESQTVRPAGAALLGGDAGVLLVGYDVEATDAAVTAAFLRDAAALHRELRAPCTFFVLGTTLAAHGEALAALDDDPLFEVATHTWSHERLKTVLERRPGPAGGELLHYYRGVSLEAAAGSLARVRLTAEETLGRPPVGLSAPWGYHRGLADRPDVLSLLAAAGIRYVRSWARDPDDWQPLSLDAQPTWYGLQGHPALLEIPGQGWQDVLWWDAHGWDDVEGYGAELEARLRETATADRVWSVVLHDWSLRRADPDLGLVRSLLEAAREAGVTLSTHAAYREAAWKERWKQLSD